MSFNHKKQCRKFSKLLCYCKVKKQTLTNYLNRYANISEKSKPYCENIWLDDWAGIGEKTRIINLVTLAVQIFSLYENFLSFLTTNKRYFLFKKNAMRFCSLFTSFPTATLCHFPAQFLMLIIKYIKNSLPSLYRLGLKDFLSLWEPIFLSFLFTRRMFCGQNETTLHRYPAEASANWLNNCAGCCLVSPDSGWELTWSRCQETH